MTNDASVSGIPDDRAPIADPDCADWESTALQRVAERHRELHGASPDAATLRRATDWERRALECLKRYFRALR